MVNQEPRKSIDIVNAFVLARFPASHGPVWTTQSEDLNVNLLVFGKGEGIEPHVNREVDVLVVGIEGEGELEIDGRVEPLAAGQLVVIPKGAQRSIRVTGERLVYLTCHRRRAGLWPTNSRR